MKIIAHIYEATNSEDLYGYRGEGKEETWLLLRNMINRTLLAGEYPDQRKIWKVIAVPKVQAPRV